MLNNIYSALLNDQLLKRVAELVGRPGSLRFRLARDTLGVMVLKALSMGLGFLISVILARVLGVREFGLYAFAMSLLGLLSAPAAFGFPQLLVREIAAYRVKEEWSSIRALLRFSQRTALGASLGLALLVGLGLWLFSDRLSAGSEATLAIALVALPFMALMQLQGSALRGFDRILEGQMVNGVLRPLSFLVLIGGVWLLSRALLNATMAVGLQAVAAGATVLVGWSFLRRQVRAEGPEVPLTQRNSLWLRSALWLLLLTLLNLIPEHSGVLLLGTMQGTEEVGLYKVAFRTASVIPFGLMAIGTVTAPILAQLYTVRNRRGLKRVLMTSCVAGSAFALPLVLLFVLRAMWFLRTVFGEPFMEASTALAILAIAQFVNAATGPVGLFLIMSEHEGKATLCVAIGAGISLLLSTVLIPICGVEGAAIAFGFALIIKNLVLLYFSSRILERL